MGKRWFHEGLGVYISLVRCESVMNRTIICVLAGGRSRRFGKSKLNVHINGMLILTYQVKRAHNVLQGLGATGQVCCRQPMAAPLGT